MMNTEYNSIILNIFEKWKKKNPCEMVTMIHGSFSHKQYKMCCCNLDRTA